MNYSKAIFLISDEARAIMATYKAEDGAIATMFKTLDPDLAVGDFVVVESDTRHHMTVCKIVEVDADVDFDASDEPKWIIGKVAKADFDELRRQENEAIAKIKSAEKRKRRKELSEALLADVNGDLKSLPIYTVGRESESQL